MTDFTLPRKYATLALLFGLTMFFSASVQLVTWGLDRRVPFELINYHVNEAQAGDAIIIRGNVKRDLSRSCTLMYSRVFYDSTGARFELTKEPQLMTAGALADLNERLPDTLLLNITVPPLAAPGAAAVVSALQYECNPVHKLYPLNMLVTFNVTVLP